MPPTDKSMITRILLSARDWFSSDIAIFASSVLAWAAATFSEIVTAIPLLIGFIFQIILRYKKFTLEQKHRQELHREAIKLLRNGKIPPSQIKDLDFD